MNQTKLEQKLRRENEMLAKHNGELNKLFTVSTLKLGAARCKCDEMEAKFKQERFNRRLYMYGFYAAVILNIVSSLCYFL